MSFVAVSVGTAAVGLGQAVIGGINAHNAQKKLENTPTPTYTPSKSINDYYQEALNRYSASPYASMMYQNAQNRIAQSQAAGINALQDRRSGLAGIGAIVGQGQNALNQAGAQAEQMRRQDFSMLGRAAGMKASDDQTAFQYNQLLPYQKRMSIFGAKASAGNQMMNSGLQNMFGGISSAAELGSLKSVGATPANPSIAPYEYTPQAANTLGASASPANDFQGNYLYYGHIDPNSAPNLISQ